MADLKADRFYDLRCDHCYMWWSTDFDGGRGMYYSRESLLGDAKLAGWRRRGYKNLCPECFRKFKEGVLNNG